MVDLCSDVLRIMDLERMRLCMHLLVVAKCDVTMLHLSTVDEVKDSDLLALGTTHLKMDTPFASAEALRDHLIELISVRNLRHRPEALFALFRQFLQRLTLPRICHFLDLVLPQLTPVRAPLGGCYSDFMDLPPHSCFLT